MRHLPILAITFALFFATGCGSKKTKVEVVDLDKVLEIFTQVADTSHSASPADANGEADPGAVASSGGVDELPEDNADAANAFLVAFQTKLNEAKLIESTIAVDMDESGMIIGFNDKNANQKYEGNETQYFTIQIDEAGSRLVASQTVPGGQYHRDRRYEGRHYSGGGMFWGYMLGSMMHRQNRFYGNPSAGRTRPNFRGMSMSQRGYHSNAVSRARSTASRSRSSARSRGGSGGFRGGK